MRQISITPFNSSKPTNTSLSPPLSASTTCPYPSRKRISSPLQATSRKKQKSPQPPPSRKKGEDAHARKLSASRCTASASERGGPVARTAVARAAAMTMSTVTAARRRGRVCWTNPELNSRVRGAIAGRANARRNTASASTQDYPVVLIAIARTAPTEGVSLTPKPPLFWLNRNLSRVCFQLSSESTWFIWFILHRFPHSVLSWTG